MYTFLLYIFPLEIVGSGGGKEEDRGKQAWI